MKLILALVSISFFISACSGGNSTRVGAPWCDSDLKAVNFEVAGAKRKIDLSKDEDLNLAEGTYELTGIEMYVNDQEKGVRLRVSASVKDGITTKTAEECIGTYWNTALASNNWPITYELEESFSLINVPEAGSAQKTTLGGGKFTVDIRQRGEGIAPLQTVFEIDDSKTTNKSLSKTNESVSEKTQYLFELSDSYEMQNRLKISDKLTIESRQVWKKKTD